jgi:hypothetical protein
LVAGTYEKASDPGCPALTIESGISPSSEEFMIRIRTLSSLHAALGCILLFCAASSVWCQDETKQPNENGESAGASTRGDGASLPPLEPVPESEPRPLTFDPYHSFEGVPPSYLGPTYAACPMPRQNRYRAFLEYLYLQPGNAAVTGYAMPVNGAIIPPPYPRVPVGATAMVDPSYSSGARLGFAVTIDPCIEWGMTYSYFDSSTSSGLAVDAQNNIVLDSLVLHPGTEAADDAFLSADGSGNLKFHLFDIDRRKMITDCSCSLAYLFGVRFAKLTRDFNSTYTNSIDVENVATTINYDAAGLRFGLDGKVRSSTSGLMLYGQAIGSLLAGRFKSSYTQTDKYRGTVAYSSRNDDSIVPILDFELGVGWASRNDRWELRAGYMFSAWYNVVSNEQFIQSVQNTQAGDIRDTLTFDGLVARAEFRF